MKGNGGGENGEKENGEERKRSDWRTKTVKSKREEREWNNKANVAEKKENGVEEEKTEERME